MSKSSLVSELRSSLNKQAKHTIAYDLHGENPTEVKTWIPTGSTVLDLVIANREGGGIPVGKITTIAGESQSGKSLIATQILANCQKMGGIAIYIDTENASDPRWMSNLGLTTDKDFLYLQTQTLESTFQAIENVIGNVRQKAPDRLVCIVWDSVAATPGQAEVEGSYDPTSQIGLSARIISRGLRKITEMIGQQKIALVLTNQLKTNIGQMFGDTRVEPGGKGLPYQASARIWLTRHTGKANGIITNDQGQLIGYRTSAQIVKNRFGPPNRTCEFNVMFDLANGDVGIRDEDSWLKVVGGSDSCPRSGAWYTLKYADGTEKKFQKADYHKLIKEEEFRQRFLDILHSELIIGYEQSVEENVS
tara:strand:+ start:2194 stop:3282 length:1089 start_codon:yes stop_codon:yes gene_type:complete